MNGLQAFKNEQFGEVRVIEQNGAPWFVAADVCKALDIANPTDAIKRLDEDEKARLNLGLSGGDTNCVNEPGLYSLVLGSRKPEAKSFKRWITHDVIPSIRKTGGYVGNEDMFVSTYLPFADDTVKSLFGQTLAALRQANAQITEMKPKALFADAVEASHTSILVGELAKLIRQNGVNIGQNRLFKWMRENGFIMRNQNIPTQRSMDMGLMEIKERTINNPDGTVRITRTIMVTGKGQTYFVNRLLAA